MGDAIGVRVLQRKVILTFYKLDQPSSARLNYSRVVICLTDRSPW